MSSHVFAHFFDVAASHPDRMFCVFRADGEDASHTYADIATGAGKYQTLLKSRGIGRGDIVVIMLDNSVDVMTAFIGTTMSGAVPSVMPLSTRKQDPALFWPAHETLFELTNVRAVITTPEGRAEIERWLFTTPGRPAPYVLLELGEQDRLAPDMSLAEVAAGDIVLLQHSSGTTGLKKGVALSHGAVLAQAAAYSASIGYTADDRIATWLPLYHDMGLITSFLLPSIYGGSIVGTGPFDWVIQPHSLFAMIEDYGCRFTWLPNFAFEHLVRTDNPDDSFDLSGMKAFVSCSEPCKRVTFERFEATFARHGVTGEMLQTCYAMAETVFAVTQSSLHRRVTPASESQIRDGAFGIPNTVSCGPAIPGMEIGILDSESRFVAEGEAGQVAVKAPYLFSGYYNRPAETAAAFVGDWYLTGDIGVLSGGELYIIGRLKDVVVVHGKNIVAHEIEGEIGRIAGVKPGRAVVFGVFNPAVGSEELIVVAETEAPGTADAVGQEVRNSVMAHCGIYPSRVKLVEPGWLVKTTSGKISRKDNQRKYLDETATARRSA